MDFLDPSVARQNTPEERVRQTYGRALVHQYGYSKGLLVFEAPINTGSETKFADIIIYDNEAAAQSKDQARVRIVVETKAPTEKKGVKPVLSVCQFR